MVELIDIEKAGNNNLKYLDFIFQRLAKNHTEGYYVQMANNVLQSLLSFTNFFASFLNAGILTITPQEKMVREAPPSNIMKKHLLTDVTKLLSF